MIYWYCRWKKIQTETTNLKFRNADHTILLDPLWANKIYLRGCQKSKDPNGEVWCIIVLLYECFLETRLFVFRSRLFLDCLHGYAVNNSYETWCNFSTMCFIVSVGVTSFHDCYSLRGVSWTYSSAVTLLYTHVWWACMLDDKLYRSFLNDYLV